MGTFGSSDAAAPNCWRLELHFFIFFLNTILNQTEWVGVTYFLYQIPQRTLPNKQRKKQTIIQLSLSETWLHIARCTSLPGAGTAASQPPPGTVFQTVPLKTGNTRFCSSASFKAWSFGYQRKSHLPLSPVRKPSGAGHVPSTSAPRGATTTLQSLSETAVPSAVTHTSQGHSTRKGLGKTTASLAVFFMASCTGSILILIIMCLIQTQEAAQML